MIKYFTAGMVGILLMDGTANAAEAGLWIGDIPLCAETVSDAKAAIDETIPDTSLSLKLNDDAAKRLHEMTRGSVGQSISIRLDGEVLSEPNIWEPIPDGEIQITGIEQATMDKIIAATQRPCPAAPHN